ncbi:uncharacterized protein LOC107262535 isoform X3 [Ricinus communis]|uniref:uncharacterized protein LOC107262535 isoform X3 n=1 Tax=Ricinus communis TaxID=3988 RepID=UPI00201AC71F|nr:uncharacterized protein LOC107262535 isoform X3 [Ricinus communis]
MRLLYNVVVYIFSYVFLSQRNDGYTSRCNLFYHFLFFLVYLLPLQVTCCLRAVAFQETVFVQEHADIIGCPIVLPRVLEHDNKTICHRMALVCGTSTCHMAVSQSKLFIYGVWEPFWSEGGQSATGALLDYIMENHVASPRLANCAASQIVKGARGTGPNVSNTKRRGVRRCCQNYSTSQYQVSPLSLCRHLSFMFFF